MKVETCWKIRNWSTQEAESTGPELGAMAGSVVSTIMPRGAGTFSGPLYRQLPLLLEITRNPVSRSAEVSISPSIQDWTEDGVITLYVSASRFH